MKPLNWYRETYIKDGYRCAYCGRNMLVDLDSWMSIEVDHVLPRSKGGGDELENRVTACHVCNRFKSGYVPDDYERMSPDELLVEARRHVLALRANWQERFVEAIDQYRNATRQDPGQ